MALETLYSPPSLKEYFNVVFFNQAYTPAISSALPLGLMATPSVPLVVNYNMFDFGQRPTFDMDTAAVAKSVGGASGENPISSISSSERRNSLPAGMDLSSSSASSSSRPHSGTAMPPRRPLGGRRYSTRHAGSIAEARRKLTEMGVNG